MKVSSELNHVIVAIESLAHQLGISTHEVTMKQLIDNGYIPSNHFVKKLGGIDLIKKTYFPFEEKDLASIAEMKNQTKYINKLEEAAGNKALFQKTLIDAIDKNLKPLPRPKTVKFKKEKDENKTTIVSMLNDTHYGLKIDKDEIDNLNSFSWVEACRRTAFTVKKTINFKKHRKNQYRKLHLVLNGDLLAGIIHGTKSQTLELWIHQVNGGTNILTNAIHQYSQEFNEVVVSCVGGNHEELPHKREGGHRVTQEHYDNFSNSMFYALSVAFRNYSNVSFDIPKTPYLFLDLPAGRAGVFHGHNLFSKALGNPGKAINVKGLTDSIRDFNAGELGKGRDPLKLVLFGHTHCHFHFITNDGVEVYGAPSLSGLDGFAHQLTINSNFIGQVVFESTKDFILADARLIRLKSADKDSSLDNIIPIYKNQLKWENKKEKK